MQEQDTKVITASEYVKWLETLGPDDDTPALEARLTEQVITCPECGTKFSQYEGRCACGLSWEDVEAAADFFDRLVEQ